MLEDKITRGIVIGNKKRYDDSVRQIEKKDTETEVIL